MLRIALRNAASSDRLLVATDFDGTLTPLCDDPDAASPLPLGMAALTALCGIPSTHVCIISGRSLADLWRRVPPVAGLVIRGSYGAEVHSPAPRAQLGAALDGLFGRLSAALSSTPARLERKSMGVAVHTRGIDPRTAEHANSLARDAAAPVPGVRVFAGFDVLDFSLAGSDKGASLREEVGSFAPTAVVVLGDDAEDERMFAEARPGGVTIKVGDAPTVAAFRVGAPEQAARALAELSESRARWAAERS